MHRAGNPRRTRGRALRVVAALLPGGGVKLFRTGRYTYTHAVIARKGRTLEPGYPAGTWHAISVHESRPRAALAAEYKGRERRISWASGTPERCEPRWSQIRVVRVTVVEGRAWAGD